MEFKESKIKGLFEIIPRVFRDERGYFFETFSDKLFRANVADVTFVAVDIRPNSPTFGQYEAFLLSAEKQNMLYVPEGFAHGFATVEDAIFTYKCTNFYDKASEAGIIFNDPDLNINWGIENPLVSEKDLELPTLKELMALV